MIFLPGQMVCLDFVTEQSQASDWSRHPEKEAAATTSPLQAKAKTMDFVMWWEIKLFEDDVCKVRFNLNW